MSISDMSPTDCSEWEDALATMHPDDFTSSEWAALNEHIALCSKCASIRAEHLRMRQFIQGLDTSELLPIYFDF